MQNGDFGVLYEDTSTLPTLRVIRTLRSNSMPLRSNRSRLVPNSIFEWFVIFREERCTRLTK